MKRKNTIFLLVFLVMPYLLLLFIGFEINVSAASELTPYLLWSSLHSALTATLCIFMGYFGAIGLLSLKRFKKTISSLIILPGFLPVLIVATSFLALLEALSINLSGFVAIILCQSLINVGIVSYLLSKSLMEYYGHLFQLAEVLNLNRGRFLFKILPPVLKFEFFSLWIFVFVVCFTGFVIPHLMAPLEPYSLDVLIYRKLRVFGEVGEAVYLTLLQAFILALVVFAFTPKSHKNKKLQAVKRLPQKYSLKLGLILPLLISAFLIFFELMHIPTYFGTFFDIPFLDLKKAFAGTIAIASGAFAFTFIILNFYSVASIQSKMREGLLTYVAPSSVLVGLLVVVYGLSDYPLFSISLCFAFLTSFVVYRLGFYSELVSLHPQIELAKATGVNLCWLYKKILFPQLSPRAFYLSGIAAFWSVGEYTLSMMIASNDISLSLWVKSMLKAYRFEQAASLNIVILLIGILFYFLGECLSYVSRKKFS